MRPDKFGEQLELLSQSARYAEEYLRTLDDRPVFPDARALQALDEFDEPLPETSAEAADTLAMLHRVGSPGTVAQAREAARS